VEIFRNQERNRDRHGLDAPPPGRIYQILPMQHRAVDENKMVASSDTMAQRQNEQARLRRLRRNSVAYAEV
jgi:hypothetical protein